MANAKKFRRGDSFSLLNSYLARLSSRGKPDRLQKTRDLALEAYRLLVDLTKHEEEMLWKRTQLFFVLNSAFVGFLGLVWSSERGAVANAGLNLFKVVCFYGIFTSLLWPVLIKRTVDFYDHWVEQLKFLESNYLVPINIFNIADKYFVEGTVTFAGQVFKMGRISRQLRIHQLLTFIPFIFLIVWSCLLIVVS